MSEDILRYKYLPFNDDSICVISEGTIKFSSPDEFNDPFDCAPDIDTKKTLEYLSKDKNILKQVGNNLGYSPAQRIQNKNRMINSLEREMLKPDWGRRLAEDVGICSLSRNPLNLLMWAHYANDHTGFVVEFSIPQTGEGTETEASDFITKYLFPLEVIYSDEKPLINPLESQMINMEKQFLTKGRDWEYEAEERVLDHVRGKGIYTFDRERVLKSVFAGLRMSDNDYLKLEVAVNAINSTLNMNVQLFRVEFVKGEYALSIPERTDLN